MGYLLARADGRHSRVADNELAPLFGVAHTERIISDLLDSDSGVLEPVVQIDEHVRLVFLSLLQSFLIYMFLYIS